MVMQCLLFRYILSFYNNKWKSPLVLCSSKCFINKDHIISCFWFSNLRHILQLQFCHALLISKVSDILKTVFGRGPKRHCNPLSFDCFLIIFSPISCYCVLVKQTSVDRYDSFFGGQILINDGMCIWIGLWFSSFLWK